MKIDARVLLFAFLGILVAWFVYVERAIFTPFILAAIFAYLFNPVVDFFSKKLKLSRVAAILVIYLFLISIFVLGTIVISSRIIEESADLRTFSNTLFTQAHAEIRNLPDWMRPSANDFIHSLQRSKILTVFSSASFFPFFSQAISRIVSFLIFLFSAFYFLKDGKSFFEKLIEKVRPTYKVDVENLLKEVSTVLNGYLRGQIFLIFLMSVFTYIALAIIGIRFALIIAIFSGFAEIVPLFGPIVAASIAVLVALVTGTAHFGLAPANAAFIIVVVYFVLRHIEDYFVIPHVMGKITKLHPFMILFAVIAGGHIWGVLGLILAVPVAAILRIFLEFSVEKIPLK